jgi:hypothetical protein
MTEIGRIIAHKTTHQDGGSDELDLSGLAGQQIWVPKNGKIADITHADVNDHTLNLATALSETRNIIALVLSCIRISGTGTMYGYPNEGATPVVVPLYSASGLVIIKDGLNRLKYYLSVANDDFDLYCFGYVVEA